jgi:hypothetical protein
MSSKRTILAFLVAPLMTPLVFCASDLMFRFFGPKYPIPIAFDPTLYILIGVYAYLATAVFGVPMYFLFRALHLRNMLLFVVGGAVIGSIVSFILIHSYPLFGFWTMVDRVGFALAGALSALAFRLILFRLNFDAPATRWT